jgi:hypothetical protein
MDIGVQSQNILERSGSASVSSFDDALNSQNMGARLTVFNDSSPGPVPDSITSPLKITNPKTPIWLEHHFFRGINYFNIAAGDNTYRLPKPFKRYSPGEGYIFESSSQNPVVINVRREFNAEFTFSQEDNESGYTIEAKPAPGVDNKSDFLEEVPRARSLRSRRHFGALSQRPSLSAQGANSSGAHTPRLPLNEAPALSDPSGTNNPTIMVNGEPVEI